MITTSFAKVFLSAAVILNPYLPLWGAELDGTQVENGVTFVVPYHDFSSDSTGTSDKSDRVMFFPATFYLTHKYNQKLSAGLGIYTPFGLGTRWEEDWEGRYIVTEAELQSLNFNPAIAYQVTPTLSLAAGLDVLYIDAMLENKINFYALGFADGNQRVTGNGIGYGYNLGIYSPLTNDLAFGLTYRSGIDVDIEGNVKFKRPSPTLDASFPNSAIEVSIDFPQQVHAAFAYSGFEKMVIEAGVRWEDWSSYDELRFETAELVNGGTTSTRPTNWRDTYTLTLGGRYELNDKTRLLAGFVRGQDPIPNNTFEQSVLDSPHYALTFGSEHSLGKHNLAFAYAYQKWFDRSKRNNVGSQFSGGSVPDARANGEYQSFKHFFAVSFTYVF
jgi:long-chain fatty acid transport protein